MKNIFYATLVIFALASCSKPVLKSTAYKKMYDEKPKTILIMPPINKSTNVEAKEYFHSTLYVPLADHGYYVIPPFLSMEILRKESAYDAELFLEGSLEKFGEIFGADATLFTIIHKWNKSSIGAKVTVEVEYILKSTKTGAVLYTRRGVAVYNTGQDVNKSGVAGLAMQLAVNAVATAATDYTVVARKCNFYTFMDLPAGNYHPKHKIDGAEPAGQKKFEVQLR